MSKPAWDTENGINGYIKSAWQRLKYWWKTKVVGSSIYNKVTGDALTGAEREANAFSAEQAQLERDWQEEMYLKYNSPSALMSQYREAGLNPALMYGQNVSGNMSANASAPSSVTPDSGTSLDQIVNLIGLKTQLDLTKSQIRKTDAEAEGQEINNWSLDDLNRVKIDASRQEIQKMKQDIAESKSRIELNGSSIEINGKRLDLMDSQILVNKSEIPLNEKELAVKDANIRLQSLSADQIAAALPYVAAMQQAEINYKNAASSELKSAEASNYQTALNAFLSQPGILSDNERKEFEAATAGSEAAASAIENKPGWVKARLIGDVIGKALSVVATGAGIYFGAGALGKSAAAVSASRTLEVPYLQDAAGKPLATYKTTIKY